MPLTFPRLQLFFLILCLVVSSSKSLQSQNFKDMFISKEDGAVDMSAFLNSTTGFLPIPIIITEPAVGFGGGLALAYFHKGKAFDNAGTKGLSPTVSFAAGAYTTNGTWLAIGGHQGSYLKDRIRYLGVIGYVSPNLTFYGAGIDRLDGRYEFNMKGFLTLQELLYRVKKEIPLFMGLNYMYFNNDITFKTGIELPGWEEFTTETNTAGMNAVFMWDSRDNSFTPNEGIKSSLELGVYSQALGGDNDYGNFDSRTYFYAPVVDKKLFSGYRLQLTSKWGDVPFYELPFISLRGIPALRYQDNNVYTVETEWRWNFVKRWSAVGFIGAGEAMDSYGDIFNDVKVAGGGGIRYFLAKEYGLHAGVDIARGPEIWAWNITVGSNWMR